MPHSSTHLTRLRWTACLLPLLLFGIAGRRSDADGQAPAKPGYAVHATPAEDAESAAADLFETKVRPVLARRCYSCHSAASAKSLGGLRLDTRQGPLTGGSRGTALVPGHPDKSLLIEAISYGRADLKMPPDGKLADSAIADISEWVRRGAVWPSARAAARPVAVSAKMRHWAFQPVRKPALPLVKRRTWVKNDIDRFILAKLESRGLTPSAPADRRTLIRRACFDLTGLPPTPEEVEAFVGDRSPDAWPRLVDRLLASPLYGERWGRFWLDVARYGEDQAHNFEPRLYPQGFRYRDWVANSLNSDMPYDRFVREQIAADLLNEPDRLQQLPALGFFAVGPVYYGDARMFDQYDDRIDTLCRGFLGLTVACARCHDHKFDPITQKDYYGLAGVFASTNYVEVAVSDSNSPSTGQTAGANRNELIKAKQTEVDKFVREQTDQIRTRLIGETGAYFAAALKLHDRRVADSKAPLEPVAAMEKVDPIVLDRWYRYLTGPAASRPLLAPWRDLAEKSKAAPDGAARESLIATARKAGSDLQSAILLLMKRRETAKTGAASAAPALTQPEAETLDELTGDSGVLTVPADRLELFLTGDPKAHYAVIKPELERLKMGAFVHALSDGAKPANVHVLLRGNPDTPGDEAPRRFLSVIAGENAPAFHQGSGRLELANAIADRSNPLTARVMVNRVWQHHFGRGLARTASNFGLLGEAPTHPELLDYLAARFMERGWSLKALHREIMLSATYQMSSEATGKGNDIDADDRLLWRMPRRRLEVEAWRDAMLSVAGKLDLTVGGPSVSLSNADNNRRTFYAQVSRHDLNALLRLFDFPDPNVTADARTTTTVPLQQLFVLNSDFMVRLAKALAARMTADANEADASRIKRAFLLVYGRQPEPREMTMGLAFLRGPKSPVRTAVTTASSAPDSGSRLSRWEEYAQALLASNEFMYID